jgi:predicted ATPase
MVKKTTGITLPNLRKISLLRDKIIDWNQYPLSVPIIKDLVEIDINKRVCFFVGENGSGKSTLIEAIAEKCGFAKEGGSQNMTYASTSEIASAASSLSSFLRLSWNKKMHSGYFLRAESFFNVATYLDELEKEEGRTLDNYEGASLHKKSHGESFLSLFRSRFSGNGFYLLDEPEAALSPQRQLSFLAILHDAVNKFSECQFIIVTHSPIILAYPEAQILSFNNSQIEEVGYKQTEVYQTTHRFLSNPESYLRHLLIDD